ncbi:hypothetical protein NM688_g2354 [Phlebia brevispora]|uniref:Uncharacterized protein n=1 Tax=Phlebia brevispora TaxID=194682 RepID=A0ACC1T8Q0_9APHY|nr:hypothetical protein NM688_g2354 [Phlebia brevispora]
MGANMGGMGMGNMGQFPGAGGFDAGSMQGMGGWEGQDMMGMGGMTMGWHGYGRYGHEQRDGFERDEWRYGHESWYEYEPWHGHGWRDAKYGRRDGQHGHGSLPPLWQPTTIARGCIRSGTEPYTCMEPTLIFVPGRQLTELAMCQFSATIRSREGWWTKIDSSKVKEAWRRMGEEPCTIQTSSGPSEIRLSPKQIDYVLQELAGYVALLDTVGHCQVSCFDRIWETTLAVSIKLLSTINKDLDRVRSGRRKVDTDSVRTDVVDPCLRPIVYGQTLIKGPDGGLHPVPHPQLSEDAYGLSPHFAWIPTPFSVTASVLPLSAHALSYISGIDPALERLYAGIDELVARTIPLFEHVLTDLSRDNPLYHRIPGDCTYTVWDEPEEPEHSDDEEGWLNYQKEMRHWTLNRPIVYPDIPSGGYPRDLEVRHSQTSLRGKNVKIYTQIMDIDLKPGGPSYAGTPWHAAGMRNEHIVAVSVQCLAMDNIAPMGIDIRMPVRSPRKFLPGDAGATSRAWGLSAGAPSHQFVGTPTVRLGHAVAFPNIYQWRLTEAQLQDDSKKGSMRLVLFYLADPQTSADDSEVPSSAIIPPQEMSWTRKAVEDFMDPRVPVEIVEKIMSFVEGLVSDEQASRVAVRMKRERERFASVHDQQWFSLPFNIWQN